MSSSPGLSKTKMNATAPWPRSRKPNGLKVTRKKGGTRHPQEEAKTST